MRPKKGLPVVIMEPLRGGALAKEPPESIKALWAGAPHPFSHVEYALHWLWSQPEVSVVLSGMSTFEQVEQNIASAERSQIGLLEEADQRVIDQVRTRYEELMPIPCTGCEYCLPCPNGLKIPDILEIYNSSIMYEDVGRGKFLYNLRKQEIKRRGMHPMPGVRGKMPPGHRDLGLARKGALGSQPGREGLFRK